MRVDAHGQTLGLLRPGERKSLQTDRVILVPGPAEEIATVDRIYRLFVDAGKTEAEIAEILNRDNIFTFSSTITACVMLSRGRRASSVSGSWFQLSSSTKS